MSHADRQQPEGPGPAGQIGVFLLDDHEIVRRGVRELLDPEAASRVMRRMRDQAAQSDPLSGLTGQERRILELIGEGLTNRQIGAKMFLAEKTIKNYVSALFAKLGMERRTQAAAYAARVFDSPDQAERGTPAS
jgi:DNA-binding CsgD family transcriptional regulator